MKPRYPGEVFFVSSIVKKLEKTSDFPLIILDFRKLSI